MQRVVGIEPSHSRSSIHGFPVVHISDALVWDDDAWTTPRIPLVMRQYDSTYLVYILWIRGWAIFIPAHTLQGHQFSTINPEEMAEAALSRNRFAMF